MPQSQTLNAEEKDRARRMKWWHEARFGMFIHWGLYSQLGRHEWAMNRERIPLAQYEKLADSWRPKPRPMREWARLAKAAGMKYMVMTTKHHEGFCLWDTRQHDYNAVRRGPGRDLVAEYVEAAREFGLRVGFYYSLMDWHHPDGARCFYDAKARRRFLDFTQGCVRELMSNYGKIDVLWYDVAWPLKGPEGWESRKMNRMVRQLQPDIIINDRSHLPEDFGTPEEVIKPAEAGRGWEACMTFNGFWGYKGIGPAEDWLSVRKVVDMLRRVTGGGGNLLLNIGPAADGSVPPEATARLSKVGQWLRRYGEAMYGSVDRAANMDWMPVGQWSLKGKCAYLWVFNWTGEELAVGGLKSKVKRVTIVGESKALKFEQTATRVVIRGLPRKEPDGIAHVTVLRFDCVSRPRQHLGAGYVEVAGA